MRDNEKARELREGLRGSLRVLSDDYKETMSLMIAMGYALDVERVQVDEWRQTKIVEHYNAFDHALTELLINMRRDFLGATSDELAVA